MRLTLLLLATMLVLIGCGKRGPLYLPDSPGQAQGTQTAPAQEAVRR